MSRMLRLGTAFVVALALSGVWAGGALGQAVQCGQVVTEDVTLESDLSCPAGSTALSIGADGVVVDLNGHTISADSLGGGTGIANTDGSHDVVIRNGTLSGFATGILLDSASDNRLARLNIPFARGNGVLISGGQRNVVRDSTISSRGAGIDVRGSHVMRIVGNTVTATVSGTAMSLETGFSVIARNTATQRFLSGVVVGGSFNRIVENRLNGGIGCDLLLYTGTNNRIARNLVTDAVAGGGHADGICVAADTTNTVLAHNGAAGNPDDGIDVASPSASLTRNVGNTNGDYGIEAVQGVVDAGGNHASGNGNPLQCLNVFCTP